MNSEGIPEKPSKGLSPVLPSYHPDSSGMKSKGVFLTRCQAITIVIFFLLIVVAVGLMAGLIRPPCPVYGETKQDNGVETDPPPIQPRQEPWLDPFLPDYIHPVHYQLYQYPDFYFEGNIFQGSETVEIRVDQDSQHILINIKAMNITSTQVTDMLDTPLTINRTFAYAVNQYWVVEMVDVIPAGTSVKLLLDFTGSLTNGIVGYYKSTYINSETGIQSWLATTKFQPSDSRKAFPNFDEPRFKAQFTVTLRHWNNFTALGNMPVESFVDVDGTWRETTFQRTVTMSSYLVCFIVCDFSKKDSVLATGTPISMYAQPDKIDQVDYGLAQTKVIMDHMESLFQINFHLPKMDSLAVPDYPSGATEHWGLVTYRVGRLLYDPNQVSDDDKQSVLMIVAHEMAHNYFGNAITCYWWDDLWLNEGFASYYESKEAHFADPEMNALGQFVLLDMQDIMESDGSNSSRPLLIDINSPDEANAAFDGITYSKGSSMLRMMEGFLTESVFTQGARNFLTNFEFQSVTTQDLWDSMQLAVTENINVTEIMRPWVYQRGLPVIDVTLEGGMIRATQRRFMKDPDADPTQPPSPYNYRWFVPLNYRTQSGATDLMWVRGDEDSITFPDPNAGTEDWIKFNDEQYIYHRVNYDAVLLSRINQQINTNYTVFSPINRANLLDDALNIARAGQAPYGGVLNLTLYLIGEVSYDPWRASRNGLSYISDMLYTSADYSLFRSYIQRITTPRMNQIKVEDSGSHIEKLNRQDIIRLSCGHGYSQCLQNTTRFFAYWLQNDTTFPVPLNIRRVVYAYGMQQMGEDEEFDIMWDRYTKSTSTQEADNILYGMTWTTRLWLIQRLLDYSMDESKIKSQDFFTVINYIASNEDANGYLWDWVRANYPDIVARFGLDNRSLGRMVPNVVSGYSTEFQLQEVEAFFAQYPEAGTGTQARADALDSIRNNIKWRDRSEQEIIDWLILYGHR